MFMLLEARTAWQVSNSFSVLDIAFLLHSTVHLPNEKERKIVSLEKSSTLARLADPTSSTRRAESRRAPAWGENSRGVGPAIVDSHCQIAFTSQTSHLPV